MNYEPFMRVAIEEARKSTSEDPGYVHPYVGVVILQDGKVVVTAYRNENGKGSHGEYIALRKAEEFPYIDTVITTLEPCTYRSNHSTAHISSARPCAERIAEARIKTVIVGMTDPNPRIRGKGIQYLRESGIEVFEGILEEAIRELNAEFIEKYTRKR